MPLFGKIVVIKRNGTDGTHFPLTASSCLFGRKKECDIRIQMPQVSKEHCKIEINENKEAVLFNLSSTNPTQLNGNQFQDPTHLNHGDVLTIIDRSFRFEYPPHPLPQKRLSRSQEKETLQILHVQHMQQVELLHPQNSDYKSSPITGKKLESHPLSSNEKRTQEQYSTPEFKYKMHNTEEMNEMSPFSKLYELMKHEGGTDNIKEDTGNETLLEDVLHSTSRRSSVSRAKLTKVEHSEDSKIQEKGGIIANPVPILSEEKNSEKSLSIQSCGMKQKQECDGTNQSDVKDTEYNEVGKSQIIKSASNYACFKTNRQSAQHFPESCCIVSLDYTEKARCLNKINLADAFTSVENILPKPKSSRDCTQSSRNSRRSSKSRRSWLEMDSLNRTKSSGETEEHSVQISTEQPESDVLIENVYSKTNENRELVTEATQNLKDSEDGNSSTVFSSLHFNTSKNCNSSIELNEHVSKEYSCVEAIGIDKSVIIPADPSQTSGIMANQIPEKNLGTGCPINENKIKISIEGHEQNVNMKNNIPAFSSSYESHVQTLAKDDAVFEMNLSSPLKVIKKSEAKKSQKRKGTELDLLVQPFGKRKRVSFGGQLSPELFDKRLPPNSPLKKGAIPARLSMPFGNSPRAVLKKTSELRQAVIKGSSERKQQENTVPKQAASHSVLQRQECFFVPHVASQYSKDEKATAQEMHVNRLSPEVKKAECDEPESKALPSLRRSKPNTPRRSSMLGKGGAMDEEVTAQEVHVNSLFTEVKKTECDEPESKALPSLRRSKPNTPRRSSMLGKGGAMDEEVTSQEMHVNSLFTEVKKTECDEPESKALPSLRRSKPNTPRRGSMLGKGGAMDEEVTAQEIHVNSLFTEVKKTECDEPESKALPSLRRSKPNTPRRGSMLGKGGAMDEEVTAQEMHVNSLFTEVKKTECDGPESKALPSLRRSKPNTPRRSSMLGKGGAMDEEVTAQEMHVNSLFTEVKKTECDEPESKALPSLRRSKPNTPRRSSMLGKGGAMDEEVTAQEMHVNSLFTEVKKTECDEPESKALPSLRRSKPNTPRRSSVLGKGGAMDEEVTAQEMHGNSLSTEVKKTECDEPESKAASSLRRSNPNTPRRSSVLGKGGAMDEEVTAQEMHGNSLFTEVKKTECDEPKFKALPSLRSKPNSPRRSSMLGKGGAMDEEVTAQEMHVNSLFTEVKKTECDEPESKALPSLRRSKPNTPRRSSVLGKGGAMDEEVTAQEMHVNSLFTEVKKTEFDEPESKALPSLRRSKPNSPRRSSMLGKGGAMDEEITAQEMHVNSLSTEVKKTECDEPESKAASSLRRSNPNTPRRSSVLGKGGAMDEEVTAQEMHVNSLFTEVKKTECDEPESKALPSLRSKPNTPRRNSMHGKGGAMDEEVTAEEMHGNSLFTEVKKTECDEPESKALPSLRRSKPNTPRRSSMLGKGGAMDEEVTAQEMHVNSLFTEVKKTECDEPESKALPSLRRSKPNTPRRSSVLGKGGAMDEEVTAQEMHGNSLSTEVKKTECDEPESKAASSLRRSNPNTPRRSSMLGKGGAMDEEVTAQEMHVNSLFTEVKKTECDEPESKALPSLRRSKPNTPRRSSVLGKGGAMDEEVTAQEMHVNSLFTEVKKTEFDEPESKALPSLRRSKPNSPRRSSMLGKGGAMDEEITAQEMHVNSLSTEVKKTECDEPESKAASSLRRSNPNTPRRSSVLGKGGAMDEEVTAQEMHVNSLFTEVKKTECDEPESKALPSLRSKPNTPRRNSMHGKGGAMDEEVTAEEMHGNSLFTEVKKTECDEPEPKALPSLRRSKPNTPRRSSMLGKGGAMDAIRSKRRSGASKANLIVAKSWAEVVKQGVPKLQLKSASKQGFKRSAKKMPSKSSKNTNLLKAPERKISGHFTTAHANSPAPVVIGKAHTGIMNITAQIPKVVINYPLKQHYDFSESFTGLAEMFHAPPTGKEKSFVPETLTSKPEIMSEMNASEDYEKKSVLDFNISSQKTHYNQDVTSPVLEEVSQISILDQGNLKMTTGETSIKKYIEEENLLVSLNENNIMGMEEENLQQESEPVKLLLGVKKLLKTPEQKLESMEAFSGVKTLLRTSEKKSGPVEVISGVKRQLRTPKQKSEPVEALSGVKRLLRTPKQKSEPVEALSGVKRLLKTPKQKSEPVEALSGVKRLLKTPKQKSEPVEALSGVKRLLKTPKQKSEPVEALSGVKRLLRTPKQKSEPVEALSGVKRLLKTPKQKSESVEALSGVKRLLKTPKQKSEPVEVLSGIKTILKTPKRNMEPLVDDVYTKSVVSTEEVLANMVGSVTKKKTKQGMHPMEDININNITEEFKETVKPIEDRESIQLMTQKQRFEHINNVVGICQRLKTSKSNSMPTDDYLELQRFMTESKESSISPAIDYTDVKEMLDTENEHNAKLPESVNLVEENGSYITSRNQLESVENVSGSCKVKLEVTFERESHFPVTKNNSSSVPKHVGHVACNSFNELKTEFNEETTRAVYLSESYEADGMSSKNEAKTDFVKEAAANPDALDTEKLESLPLVRTRRRKINDCSCAVYTKEVQRPTKNSRRPRSANCEQTSESFDSQTELNPMDKSESSFTTIETKTKQSQRGRPKKLPVKTNGNIGPGNISHTQQLQKPSKETTVEEQSINRRKVATKRNGKIEANMDLEENGPTPENEGDLTAKIWLRSGNVKKSASDLNTKFDEGKTNNALSGEESIKRNRRGKNAVIQSSPETLITTFNEHKQGRKKYTVSKIRKTETSANNLTGTKENLVRKGKGKNVHFLLKSDFKVSEEKCVLRYEDNAPEEEESAFLESSVSPKENTSQSCKRKAVPVERHLICMSYLKEKRTLENCRDSHKQDIHVSFKNVTPETNLPAFNSSFVQEKSMLEIQTESISTEIPKVPLESMQTPAEHNPLRREKLAKKYLPGRGRGKKAISSPSIESDSKSAFDVKEEKQPKRGRGRKMVQMLPKPIPLENTAFGEEDSTINSFPSAQGGYSLPQIQDETVKEAEKKPLENVQILEKYIPPKRVVKENPPRRGRSKQVNKTSSNEAADVQDPNMVISQEDNQSRRGRRKRSAPESSSLKSQRMVKENPPRQGRHKQTMSGEISAHCDSTQITAIKDQNIVGKNACPAKENQSKMSGRRKITLVFQKTLSPVKNDTFHLLSPNKGKHSDEQPTEGLKTANNANENLSHKRRRRKADDEISASSVSSCKIAKLIDNDIQENRTKDLEPVAKQNISRRCKRKQLTPYGIATERNDELRINSKKTEPVTDKVEPLENSFEKKHQSKKQREETTVASLVSPSLKVSITLSPLSSADENQSGNRKDSVGKGKLAKHSGTYNIMTRSVRGKCMVQKEEFFHEKENKDYKQKTAMASENNQRRGRRKIKLEAAVSPSLKEKCILPTGSDIVPNDQIMILNNVSNKKISLMGKGQNILKMKTMTQNTNQGNSSNYDQNKNVEHSNMLVQKSSSKWGKRKISSNSETNVSPDTMKNEFPENKSTISKAENTGSVRVQTRRKKKMKEENTTLVTELPGETEGRTRASKRIRK